jgi:hypothetical protein
MKSEWVKQRAFEFDWVVSGVSQQTRCIYRYYADGNVRGMTLPIGHPRYDTLERIEQAFDSIADRVSPKLRTENEFDDLFSREMQTQKGIEVVHRPFYARRTFAESSRQDWDEWQELRRRACNPIANEA